MKLSSTLREWFVADTAAHPMTPEEKQHRRELLTQIETMTPDEVRSMIEGEIKTLGGPGSGNFGHAGRPGEVGGSTTQSGATAITMREFDTARFESMQKEWSKLNDEMFKYVDQPDSPEARALIDKQKALVKEIQKLDVDPGGLEGIGKPGGPKDLVVIGGGPGGMTAGVNGGFERLETVVIEADVPGGQAGKSSRIENYPGFPVGVTGEQLSGNMVDQAERVGAEVRTGLRATGLSYDDKTGLKTVTLSNGETIQARSVIIAGGLEARSAPWPGAEKAEIYYDSKSLSEASKDRLVVVAGGSNGAAQAALGAAQVAEHVTVISRNPITSSMSGSVATSIKTHPRITALEGQDISAWTDGRLQLKNGTSVPADTIGVFYGSAPTTEWCPPEVRRNSKGKIITDSTGTTGIPGVFAVGDVRADREGIGRVGVAVGDAQIAVHGVFQYFAAEKQKTAQPPLNATAQPSTQRLQ